MELTPADIEHMRAGALLLACSVYPEQCHAYADRLLATMARTGRRPRLVQPADLDDDALVVSLGFVMRGLPTTELLPVGDEFTTSLASLERHLGRPFDAVYPLAGANVNAFVPLLAAVETGLPVVDADPMGRVFPLLSQTTLAANGVPAGPLAVTGATGESAVIDVAAPARAERIVRALAGEFGGWAATASYPVTVETLRTKGVVGSVSRLVHLGRALASPMLLPDRLRALESLVGLRRVIRARVTDVEGLSRMPAPDQTDHPTSVTLFDDVHRRVVRLEIQNEILLMMVDGAVEAAMPDVITMLRGADGQVAGLEDLWVGNKVDLLSFPADPQWYEPSALAIGGAAAFGISIGHRDEGS